MTDKRKGNGEEDSVESSEVLVGNDGADDGCGVGPEGVELGDTEGGALSHAESTRLTVRSRVATGALHDAIDYRKLLLDKVRVWQNQYAVM